MAHTFILADGSTGGDSVTLSIASGTSGAFLGNGSENNGYKPSPSIAEVSYSASLYRNSQRPRFSRYGNVTDDLEVTISAASADAVFTTIRKIEALLYKARAYFEKQFSQFEPVYIEFKPNGTTKSSYSAVFGGYVEEMALDDAALLSGLVTVRIKIEREPFWRAYQPRNFVTNFKASETQIFSGDVKPWGSQYIYGIGGDVPALARVAFGPKYDSGITIDKVVFAYRSNRFFNGDIGNAYQDELELGNLYTDCTATADVTASPNHTGNTRVTCTFATKTDTLRIRTSWSDDGYRNDKYRMFLRARCNSANSVTVYLKYYAKNGLGTISTSPRTTTPVTFTNTSWAMIDLGVMTLERAAKFMVYEPGSEYDPADPPILYVELYASATTTADVYFDILLYVPCDESYMTLSGLNSTSLKKQFYASTIEPLARGYPTASLFNASWQPSHHLANPAAVGTGSFHIPSGGGRLVWVAGDSNFQNTYGEAKTCTLQVYIVERYLSARGNG